MKSSQCANKLKGAVERNKSSLLHLSLELWKGGGGLDETSFVRKTTICATRFKLWTDDRSAVVTHLTYEQDKNVSQRMFLVFYSRGRRFTNVGTLLTKPSSTSAPSPPHSRCFLIQMDYPASSGAKKEGREQDELLLIPDWVIVVSMNRAEMARIEERPL